MRSATRLAALGAAVGAALGSISWYLAAPFHFLDEEKAYVFLGSSCGYSGAIVAQLERESDISERVVPLLAEDETGPLSDRICKLAAADFKSRLPWFRVGSDRWICDGLNRWSIAAYRRTFIKIPSWSVGDELLDWRSEHVALGKLGLGVNLTNRSRPLRLVREEPGPESGTRDRPPSALDEAKGNHDHWRAIGIGY